MHLFMLLLFSVPKLTLSSMLSQDFLQKMKLLDLEGVSQYISAVSTPMLVSVGAVAAATTYYLATRPKAPPPLCDLEMQSVEVPVSSSPSEAEAAVMKRAENLGSAFLHKGHSKTTDPNIGIFSQNRAEWTISELACYTYSLVSVPLYDTLGTEAISYIIEKASLSTVVCDVEDKANLVLDCIKDMEHSLKTIVLMETPSASLVDRGQQAGVQILSLQEMEALGEANHHIPVPPQPDDMAVVCFTSGTTGSPKGAMLTHGNIVSNCSSFIKLTQVSCPLSPSDVHISYLPLAHMFERGIMFVQGARIGFFQGDIRRLSDDLIALRPTVFPVVPRLLNRMHDKIFGQANTSVKRWLLELAYRRKHAELMRGIVRTDSIWDQLIFRKVQVRRTEPAGFYWKL
uniref:long-chain-fatty-acid--CoA ligase n=1 Tax=Cyprinodon variegatus TaxID=28743 RepID=A0A3Q2DGX9_CYPVA